MSRIIMLIIAAILLVFTVVASHPQTANDWLEVIVRIIVAIALLAIAAQDYKRSKADNKPAVKG